LRKSRSCPEKGACPVGPDKGGFPDKSRPRSEALSSRTSPPNCSSACASELARPIACQTAAAFVLAAACSRPSAASDRRRMNSSSMRPPLPCLVKTSRQNIASKHRVKTSRQNIASKHRVEIFLARREPHSSKLLGAKRAGALRGVVRERGLVRSDRTRRDFRTSFGREGGGHRFRNFRSMFPLRTSHAPSKPLCAKMSRALSGRRGLSGRTGQGGFPDKADPDKANFRTRRTRTRRISGQGEP